MSSLPMKQGIVVAIFGSDDDGGERSRPSLRRTLSADMSSKKWLAQNGFGSSSSPPMKKIASSKELSLCSIHTLSEDEEEEEGEERETVWASIQREQRNNKQLDIWSSVTSSQTADKSLPPPYVHPLVKRSASSLSAKSLQICTESLGSETGSDGFSSSDTESEKSESDSEKPREEQRQEVEEEEEYRAVKFSYSSGRKSSAAVAAARPAFPPPLPSLSSRCGGDGAPTLRMRTRRDNGRLVMEAVSVPASEKNFAAQRCDGRLVLNFARSDREIFAESEEELVEQFPSEKEMEIEEEEEDEEEQVQKEEIIMKKEIEITESRLINFHRLALMANKPIALPNRRNPKYMEEEESHEKPSHVAAVAKSLPLRPRGPVGRLIPPPAEAKVSTTAAASLNNYDYFWRTKINDSNDNKPASFKNPNMENDKREFVVSRGNGNYLVPLLKGYCKEPRRSLIWEPRCIATS